MGDISQMPTLPHKQLPALRQLTQWGCTRRVKKSV